ncbi:hypothetical protein LCGC14_2744840, partial [marine sediment metagenome]
LAVDESTYLISETVAASQAVVQDSSDGRLLADDEASIDVWIEDAAGSVVLGPFPTGYDAANQRFEITWNPSQLSQPGTYDVVAEAIDQGVPVVAFNVDSNDPANRRLSCVSQKLYEAGRSLGERAAEHVPANAKILMTMHSEGASALDDRLRGIQDALTQKQIIPTVVISGMLPAEAAEVITMALKADPEIKIVLCTGQADTEGAGLAVEQHFADGGFYVAGFDLSPEILRMVDEGTIDFVIDQQPYMQGFYPVIQLALYCRYGIKPASIDAGAGIVTKENAASVLKLSNEGYR